MATTYNLYKNGTKSESGVTSPKALTGLTANTDYTFQIYAETDGVETPYSKVANVKTLPVAVTGVTIAPKNATGTTGAANTKQFTGTIAPTNATNKGMKYTISPTTAGYSIGASTGLVSWTDVAVPAVITVTVTTTDGSKTDTGTLTTTAP